METIKIKHSKIQSSGFRLSFIDRKKEVGRAYLYIMHNDIHCEPFGLIEDLYVSEGARNTGLGTKIINEVIRLAKEEGCYKLIATSRFSKPHVHSLNEKLGLKRHGIEFRINLK